MEKKYDWSKLSPGWYYCEVTESLKRERAIGGYFQLRLGLTYEHSYVSKACDHDVFFVFVGQAKEQLKQCEVEELDLTPGALVDFNSQLYGWIKAVVIRQCDDNLVEIYMPRNDYVSKANTLYLRPRRE